MSNVLPFRRVVKGRRIDDERIAFASDDDVRLMLLVSPDLAPRVVVAVARMLLAMTEQAAAAGGWASLALARQRGFDLLNLVIAEYPRIPGH